MATRRRIKIEADKKNQEQRNLREYPFYSIREYWSQTSLGCNGAKPRGCSVITGGTAQKRSDVLLGMLERSIKGNIPTVIFANTWADQDFDRKLINLLDCNPNAELTITSGIDNNFSFFSGWPIIEIVQYFIACGKLTGESVSDISSYLTAYFTLIEKIYGTISLKTLLSANDVREGRLDNIETLRKKLNEESIDTKMEESLNYLEQASHERIVLNTLLQKVSNGLYPLSTEEEGYSLLKHPFNSGDVVLIHADSVKDFSVFSLYFKMELAQMRYLPFQLIISECIDDEMIFSLKEKWKSGNTVCLCAQSACTVLGGDAGKLPVQNVVVLCKEKNYPLPIGLEAELGLLGQFDYWQPVDGGDSPPVAWSFWTGSHVGMIATKCNKVMLKDVENCEAVLYGHSKILSKNEIALIRKLHD